MKRLTLVLLVVLLLTGCSETRIEESPQTAKPTETKRATAEDVGTQIQAEMHNALISLGIDYYEIILVDYELTSSDNAFDKYTFDYTIKADGVVLYVHGGGLILNHVFSPEDHGVNVSLAWIARSEEYKIV